MPKLVQTGLSEGEYAAARTALSAEVVAAREAASPAASGGDLEAGFADAASENKDIIAAAVTITVSTSIAFSDVNYSISSKAKDGTMVQKPILRSLSGVMQAGTMTAIM